jgi:hypothetical protein
VADLRVPPPTPVLSTLVIDTHKNWNGYRIENVGAPTLDTHVPRARASDILSGRFTLARMPDGASGYFLKGQGAGQDPIYALLTAGDIPPLDASKITSGILDVARIPDLDASKIVSGTFDLARIPVMDDAHIPDVCTLSGVPFKTVASDNLRASDDAEIFTTYTTYIKAKTINTTIKGQKRVKFDLRTSNSSYTVYGRIYENGVAVGTERSTTSTSYVTFSQDLNNMQYVELWYHTSDASAYAYVANFRIYANLAAGWTF